MSHSNIVFHNHRFYKAKKKIKKKSDSSLGAQEVILLQDKYTCFTIPVEVW
jgi:hypothetical protein